MIDLHVDVILQRRLFGRRAERAHRPWFRGQPLFNHADLPRMARAGYRAVCLGVHYWPVESPRAWGEVARQIAYADRLATEPGWRRMRAPSDWAELSSRGGRGIGVGVEGAHMLCGSIARAFELAALGVTYLTLAHLRSNSAAHCGWGWGSSQTEGLSAYGTELVRALGRARVAIDLAHVNGPGVLEACAHAERPVLASHSCCRAVYDHPRGLSDDAIRAIASTGGVVGILFAPDFLGAGWRGSVEAIARHAAHVAALVGVDHVALGSDFDGWIASIPREMRDCTDIGVLRTALAGHGFDSAELEAVWWRNAARVLAAQA